MQELKIPAASTQATLDWAANFEGPGFVQLTEEEFQARLPQVTYNVLYMSTNDHWKSFDMFGYYITTYMGARFF
jgi:hypothetical protein